MTALSHAAPPPDRQEGRSVDVAVNIFAKPFQTALSLVSLLHQSGRHLGTVYLQFEPYGSRYDSINPYLLIDWLRERLGADRCQVFQPDYWLDLNAADPARLHDPAYRLGIRYQYAFEQSRAQRLFLIHNDVFFFRDLLGTMLEAMDDAVAIGPLGQCWNCPASNAALAREALGREACTPERYQDWRPDAEQLARLYALGRERGFPVRPYDEAFSGIFDVQPWPLPECRVNEWACLLDLEKARQETLPFGPNLPPGAYRQCGSLCLDIGVDWFRTMHRLGFHARHFPIEKYMKHWVGTGKVRAARYLEAERHALALLRRYHPDFVRWLEAASGLALGFSGNQSPPGQ